MIPPRIRPLVVTAAVLLVHSALSEAAVISGAISEPFDYVAGTQFSDASTLNGGLGWNSTGTAAPNAAGANWGAVLNGGTASGLYRTATAPGLNSPAIGYLQGTGNALTLDALTANQTQNTGRVLGGQTIDAGTTYFSLLMSKNNDTIRTINLAFFNGGSEQFAVGQFGTGAGNSAGNIAMVMNNSNPGGLIQNTTAPIAMGIDVSHLIIGRIDWNAGGNETVSLWVDPAEVTTEAAAGATYVSTSGFNLTGLTAIRPFVGNATTISGNPVPAASGDFDEIRLGGSWESVTSLPVPEPSSIALAVLAGGSLLLRRRRA